VLLAYFYFAHCQSAQCNHLAFQDMMCV